MKRASDRPNGYRRSQFRKVVIWNPWRMRCHYCKFYVFSEYLTMDHVVPRIRGGRDATWNLVPCCEACNLRKDDSWPTCPCAFCQIGIRWHEVEYGITVDTGFITR